MLATGGTAMGDIPDWLVELASQRDEDDEEAEEPEEPEEREAI